MPNSSTMSASPRETPDRYHLSHPGLPGSTSCLPWAPEPRTTPCAWSELSETSRTEPRPAGGQQARGAGSVTHTAQAGVRRGRPWAHPRDAVWGSEKGRTLATTVTPATLVTATRTERPHPCHHRSYGAGVCHCPLPGPVAPHPRRDPAGGGPSSAGWHTLPSPSPRGPASGRTSPLILITGHGTPRKPAGGPAFRTRPLPPAGSN